MLSVKNVTMKYGNHTVLDDINIDFENGVYGLLAPNGAGKTTLIKLLATLHFASSGAVLWNGESITALDEKYRDVIGYLPQQFGFYRSYTPTAYLLYLSALKGIPKHTAKQRVDELLSLVALSDVKNVKMKKFSGGMIQRVGIAAALLNDPKLLLLDEPTAGLDPKERVRFRNIIAGLSKDRIVILSTHIVSDVESIANRIIMLQNGKIYCNETVAEVCGRLSGMVYEAELPTAETAEFSQKHFVLSERFEGDRAFLRFIGDGSEGYAPKNAGLEDVFLYLYRDAEGGNADTL